MNALRHPAQNTCRILASQLLAALVLAGLAAAPAQAFKPQHAWQQQQQQLQPQAPRPVIELMFVLDTTGSMGGMLEGAKTKIWGIVNDVLQRQGNAGATIRVGLVAYRDRGDAYVTRITPLSTNLDAVYSQLMSFRPEGGGDTPEDVRSAMADAVRAGGWSRPGPRTSQVLFLVGDAPPQSYRNVASTVVTATAARQRGIIVNAIQCGDDPDTTQAWHDVAQHGGGEYFAIAQDGGVEAIVTPYDQPLAQLGQQMGGTYMAYGADRRAKQSSQVAMEARVASAAPPPAVAERAINKALNDRAYDESDLVQKAEVSGSAAAARVADAELPDSLRALPAAERQKALDKAVAERKALKEKILALSKQREKYLADQRAKRSGKAGGFDAAVSGALARQIK